MGLIRLMGLGKAADFRQEGHEGHENGRAEGTVAECYF
jgi:hypothetical protein